MNVEKAIKILRQKGYRVTKIDGLWEVCYPKYSPDFYTDRELINLARIYTSEGQRTPIKANIKYYRHRDNRHHTKQDLAHGEYDNFYFNKLRKDSNIWDWD